MKACLWSWAISWLGKLGPLGSIVKVRWKMDCIKADQVLGSWNSGSINLSGVLCPRQIIAFTASLQPRTAVGTKQKSTHRSWMDSSLPCPTQVWNGLHPLPVALHRATPWTRLERPASVLFRHGRCQALYPGLCLPPAGECTQQPSFTVSVTLLAWSFRSDDGFHPLRWKGRYKDILHKLSRAETAPRRATEFTKSKQCWASSICAQELC